MLFTQCKPKTQVFGDEKIPKATKITTIISNNNFMSDFEIKIHFAICSCKFID